MGQNGIPEAIYLVKTEGARGATQTHTRRRIELEVTRRKFIGASASAVIAAGTMTKGQVFGANDKVRVCVIGLNGRGGSHISGFTEYEGSEVVAMCDVDERALGRRARLFEKQQGRAVKQFKDMRDAFADPDIDAVSIATPNHWHCLASIWALQAGKHVYVEKPATHNVLGRPPAHGRRQAIRQSPPARHPEPLERALDSRHPAPPVRRDHRAPLHGPRPRLQERQPRQPRLRRPERPARRARLGGSGRAPRPTSPTASSTTPTTGTGSGTSATAKSATRASTRWTSEPGA